jgi:hypothetical protein
MLGVRKTARQLHEKTIEMTATIKPHSHQTKIPSKLIKEEGEKSELRNY